MLGSYATHDHYQNQVRQRRPESWLPRYRQERICGVDGHRIRALQASAIAERMSMPSVLF